MIALHPLLHIDIAIRTGEVHSNNLVAHHHLIGNSKAPSMNQWQRQDSATPWSVKGQSLTDNSAVMLTLVRHGVGIARLLDIVARPWVPTGELVPVLRGSLDVSDIPICAVMLPERHRLPKIRACVAHWAGCLEQPHQPL